MTALDQFGMALIRLGDFENAIACLERAVEIQTRTLGADHEDTIHSRAKIGDLYHEMGRLDDARTVTENVLKVRREKWGDEYQFSPGLYERVMPNSS